MLRHPKTRLGLKRLVECSRSQKETVPLFSPSPSSEVQTHLQFWGATELADLVQLSMPVHIPIIHTWYF